MHPGDVEDYLDDLVGKLLESGGVFIGDPAITIDWSNVVGGLDASVRYDNGSRLEVTLTVVGSADYPVWTDYSFHYMDRDEKCMFRYDNTPHHHDLPFFPHHKHVGEKEVAAAQPQPSIAQILREVEAHISRT